MSEKTYLECPCCGCEGAESDAEGLFTDGQELICGCPGNVSCDPETPAWINSGNEACAKCDAEEAADVR